MNRSLRSCSALCVAAFALAVVGLPNRAEAQDECASAVVATVGPTGLDTTMLTDSVDLFDSAQCLLFPVGALARDGWLSFMPATDGLLTVSTCNSANFDTDIVIYEGPCGALTQIGCNGDNPACNNFSSELPAVQVSMGIEYLIRVGGFDPTQFGLANVVLTLAAIPATPMNDDCADAELVTAGPIAFNNLNALDSNVPVTGAVCAGTALGRVEQDLWYEYVATSDGLLDVTTCNQATFITDLIVYEGTCSNLVEVDCNGVATGCGVNADVQDVPVTAGDSYLIRIGGFDGFEVGTGTLEITLATSQPAPMNDECIGAPVIGPGTTMGDTLFATTSPEPFDDMQCTATDPGTLDRDVWFLYSPVIDGLAQITVDTMANGFDTTLVALDGACGSLTQIACNGDSAAGVLDSQLNDLPITMGVDILLRVGGFDDNEAGAFSLTITESPALLPITGLSCPADAGGLVEWMNGETYDSVTVIVDGAVSVLGGNDESFPLPPVVGDVMVEVFGTIGTFNTPTVTCTATTTCLAGATRYSNTDDLVPLALDSFACSVMATGVTADSKYLQAFNPATIAIPSVIDVAAVTFAVEVAIPGPGFVTQPVEVKLFIDPNAGPPTPFLALTEIASTIVEVPLLLNGGQICAPLPVTATIPAGGSLVMSVEVENATPPPGGNGSGHVFFIGSNDEPASALSFFAATGCGLLNPVATDGIQVPEASWLFEIVEASAEVFSRGQCDSNVNFGLSDAIFLLSVLFIVGSDNPVCADACDLDDNGNLALPDVVLILSTLFAQSPLPVPAPSPGDPCGVDPTTGDSLDCAAFDVSTCP